MANRDRDNQLIAQRIKQLRKSLKLRQEDFAERLGFDQTTVSKWEGGKARPTPDALIQIAAAAEGVDQLFFLMHAGIPDQYFMGEKMIPEIESASNQVITRALHGAAPRDRTPQSKTIAWDPELLTFVIETINKELKNRGRKLPSRKYAEMVVLIYEFCQQTGRRDSEAIERFFKVA